MNLIKNLKEIQWIFWWTLSVQKKKLSAWRGVLKTQLNYINQFLKIPNCTIGDRQ